MRRVAAGALVVLSLTAAHPASAAPQSGPGVGWRKHRGGVTQDVKGLIRTVERRFHTPGGAPRALHVAFCESSFRPNEDTGQYSGVYQIGDHEWRSWKRPHHYVRWLRGRPGPHDARANVITALFHSSHVGWGAWSCA